MAYIIFGVIIISLVANPNLFFGRYSGIMWNPNALASFSVIGFSVLLLNSRKKTNFDYLLLFIFLIMSRVARNPISVPSNVEINLTGNSIEVSGSKGKMEFLIPDSVVANFADDVITITYDESFPESFPLTFLLYLFPHLSSFAFSESFKFNDNLTSNYLFDKFNK